MDTDIGSIILFMILTGTTSIAKSNSGEQAISKATEALVKQEQIDKRLEEYILHIEDRYLPNKLKPYRSVLYTTMSYAATNKLALEWRFP